MTQIINGRGTGKTSSLLLLAKEKDYTIACQNPRILVETMYRYGLTGIDIISFEALRNGDYDHDRRVYIDELDAYLRFLNPNIAGYTLSLEGRHEG